MLTVSNLTNLYKACLVAVNCHAGSDDLLSLKSGREFHEIMIGGKRLALPTQQLTRSADPSIYQFYHPICESVNRTQSPVLLRMVDLVNRKLTLTVGGLMAELLKIAINNTADTNLTPPQVEVTRKIGRIDITTAEKFKAITLLVGTKPEYKLIDLTLRRAGTIAGVSYRRTAIISFPWLSELDSDTDTIMGVKMRKMDKNAIRHAFYTIFPDAGFPNHYSVGSQADIAPFFHALMSGLANIATYTNPILNEFKKFIQDYEDLYIQTEGWSDQLGAMEPYKSLIPPLSGNEGEISSGERGASSAPSAPAPAAISAPLLQPTQPVFQPQQMQPQPMMPMQQAIQPMQQMPMGGVQPIQPQQPMNSADEWMLNRMRQTQPQQSFAPVMAQQPMYPQQFQQPMPMVNTVQQPQMVPVVGPNGQVYYAQVANMQQTGMQPQPMMPMQQQQPFQQMMPAASTPQTFPQQQPVFNTGKPFV